MKEQWTPRGIKGATFLGVGVLLTAALNSALLAAQGSYFAIGAVHLICGVIGPILTVVGLWLLATRDKQPRK